MRAVHRYIGWLLCLLFGLILHLQGVTAALDRALADWEFGVMRAHFLQPIQNEVVLVGIDEEFLRSSPEPLVLMHRRFAALFEAVAQARPQITGLDLVLPEKSFAFLVPAQETTVNFDSELARGLIKLGAAAPLVIGETWDNASSHFRDIHPAFVSASGMWVASRGPTGFDHRGSALVCPDVDGVVRQYPGANCQPGGATRTLVGQMSKLLDRGEHLEGMINYGAGSAFSYLPATQVVAWKASGSHDQLAQLSNKIILIGVVLDNEDRLKLPVALTQWEPGNQLTPGLTLQAQMLRSILNQGLVQPVPTTWLAVLILVASGFWFGSRVRLKLLGLMGFAGALVALSLYLLRDTQFLPLGAIGVTALVSWLASALVQGHRVWLERQYLTKTFSGYVSPQILKGVLSGAIAAGRAGQRLPVCVLFSDIRGFTTLSEALPAERVVELLNSYFERMAHTVHRHEGLVDKFLGDGMMCLFGAPNILECPEKNALEAAREMLLVLYELNTQFQSAGLPALQIGIGLHSGHAIIGHVGSSERHEYTAIGDTVNVAARVCDLPKTLGYPIVCTAAVAKAVGNPDFLEDAGPQPLKGHTDMHVFGWRPTTASQP